MGRPTDSSHQPSAGNLTGLRTIIELIANLKETLNTENGQPSRESVIEFCDRILPIAQELDENAAAQDSPDVLKEMSKGMRELANATKSHHKQIMTRLDRLNTTQSWAQVAAIEALPPSIARISSPNTPFTMTTSSREARCEEKDILVNVNKDPADQPAQSPASHAETRTAETQARELINRALRGSKFDTVKGCTVGAARLLPSGDYRLITATSHETEMLKRHPEEWIACLGSNATVATKPISVIVDGIRTESLNMEKPEEVIEELRKQNPMILAKTDIRRIRWLQKPRESKKHASVVIDFTHPADANAVIRTEELFWHNEVRRVRKFVRNCSLNNCFNCNQYGHRSTQCRNSTICGWCTEKHPTAECPSRTDPNKFKCGNCRDNHPAWSPECKVRKTEKEKIRQRIQTDSRYWPEPEPAPVGPSPSAISFDFSTTPKAPAVAGPKKRGRPLMTRSENEQLPRKSRAKTADTRRDQENVDVDMADEEGSNLSSQESPAYQVTTRSSQQFHKDKAGFTVIKGL